MTAVGRGVNNGSKTKKSPRYTPYHMHHRTEIAGFMTILHGDMRFYNNIFVQQEIRPEMQTFLAPAKDSEWRDDNLVAGTFPYENYPTEEEYKAQFEGYCGMGSEPSDRYYSELPVWAGGNVYFNGAKPMSKEQAIVDNEHKVTVSVSEDADGSYTLKTNLYDFLPKEGSELITTETLGMAFEPEQKFENPDGTPIIFREDFFGKDAGVRPLAGPFAAGGAETKGL